MRTFMSFGHEPTVGHKDQVRLPLSLLGVPETRIIKRELLRATSPVSTRVIERRDPGRNSAGCDLLFKVGIGAVGAKRKLSVSSSESFPAVPSASPAVRRPLQLYHRTLFLPLARSRNAPEPVRGACGPRHPRSRWPRTHLKPRLAQTPRSRCPRARARAHAGPANWQQHTRAREARLHQRPRDLVRRRPVRTHSSSESWTHALAEVHAATTTTLPTSCVAPVQLTSSISDLTSGS